MRQHVHMYGDAIPERLSAGHVPSAVSVCILSRSRSHRRAASTAHSRHTHSHQSLTQITVSE
jgi:hypothetical protein